MAAYPEMRSPGWSWSVQSIDRASILSFPVVSPAVCVQVGSASPCVRSPSLLVSLLSLPSSLQSTNTLSPLSLSLSLSLSISFFLLVRLANLPQEKALAVSMTNNYSKTTTEMGVSERFSLLDSVSQPLGDRLFYQGFFFYFFDFCLSFLGDAEVLSWSCHSEPFRFRAKLKEVGCVRRTYFLRLFLVLLLMVSSVYPSLPLILSFVLFNCLSPPPPPHTHTHTLPLPCSRGSLCRIAVPWSSFSESQSCPAH